MLNSEIIFFGALFTLLAALLACLWVLVGTFQHKGE